MKRSPYIALAVIPIALFFIALSLGRARGPFYLQENNDPEYCYLFNALSILTFHVPQHTDHPGTTLQEFGGAVELGDWLLQRVSGATTGLSKTVLAEPERYLAAINIGLVLLICAAVFWSAAVVYRSTGSLLPALVLQCSIFLFYDLVIALARVSPEPLLIATGFAMIAVLFPTLLDPRVERASAAGFVFAFGAITKVTFFPWIMLAGVFSGWRRRLRFAFAAAAGMLILLLPVMQRIPVMASWFAALTIHSERYGQGRVGLPSLSEIMAHYNELQFTDGAILILLLYYLVVLATLRLTARKKRDPLAGTVERVLIIGCVLITVQLLVTLKHFATHYTVPSLVFAAFANPLIAILLSRPVLPPALRAALAIAALAIFFRALPDTNERVRWWIDRGHAHQAAAAQLAQKRTELGDCTAIGFYRSSLPEFALYFGSEYSGGVHAPVLKEIYSDRIMYNNFGGGFLDFAMQPRLNDVRQLLSQGRCVLLQGSLLGAGPTNLPRNFAATPVVVLPDEALYRLSLRSPDLAARR